MWTDVGNVKVVGDCLAIFYYSHKFFLLHSTITLHGANCSCVDINK